MPSPTTVYLPPRQKKRLFARAKKRGTSFSDELRAAVEMYLEFPPDFDKQELARLAHEANASMDRSIARMDETIAHCKRTMERINELQRGERYLRGL